MKKSRRFRPVAVENLEDRAVPSSFGGFLGNLIGSVPAQDARQVSQAFQSFEQTYSQDVRTILLPSGTTSPSANRAAFNQAVVSALGALSSSIDSTIQNLPTASSLAATIQGELLGSGSNTLQTLLAAVPTPTDLSFRSVRTFTRESTIYVNQVAGQVEQQVRSAPAPSGSISAQTVQQDLNQVQNAFEAFRQTYNNDVQTILLPSGTTNPTANRAQFDQAVRMALGTLNSSIASALGNLPASLTATLNTTVQNDLLSGGSTTGNSLQSRLASLRNPTGTGFFSTLFFRIGSTSDIGSAERQVTSDILTAVRQFNTPGSA